MTRWPAVSLSRPLRWLAALVFALWSAAALAQDLPARFTVAGVGAGDVLNVRAEPSAQARVLATLPPGSTGVEIVQLSPDRRWGLMAFGGGSGWVSMRFLAREAASGTPLPRPLLCRGTEPFWGLSVTGTGAAFESPDRGTVPLRPLGEVAGFGGGVSAFDAGGETLDLTVVRKACSDGMSDRPYGFTAFVWNRGETFLEGCCALSSR